MGTLEIIGMALMIVGVILCIIEMLVPGFGLPGISGMICIAAGIIMKARTWAEGLTYAFVIIVFLAVAMTIIVLIFHSKGLKSPIMLNKEMSGKDSFLGTEDMNYLIGKSGIAATDLRPVGKVDVDGVEFDVRSEGRFIDKGTQVKIVRIQGGTMIVK